MYLTWLLSKDGQTGFNNTAGYVSSRLDVPTTVADWQVPVPGAIKTYDAEALSIKDKLLALLTEVFGPA